MKVFDVNKKINGESNMIKLIMYGTVTSKLEGSNSTHAISFPFRTNTHEKDINPLLILSAMG